jgi:signal transduction histidine kinase
MMSVQPNSDLTARTMDSEWLMDKVVKNTLYLTVAVGYLLGIIAASHLTLTNFLGFTLLHILYCVVLWWLLRRVDRPNWQDFLFLGALTGLALLSGLLSATGVQWDWLIYVVTVAMYFQYLSWRGAIIISLLLEVLIIFNLSYLTSWGWWNASLNSLTVLSAFAFVGLFMRVNQLLMLQREHAEGLLHQLEASNAELAQAHTQLQKYATEVEELTVVRERTRLAREIHDTLGHYLTILSIQLEAINKLQERDPVRAIEEVAEARRVAAQSMQEVRNAVAALRPTSIATLSLPQALMQLGKDFERNAVDIALTLDLDTPLPAILPDLQVALYRVAQEALTNVHKHAHASKVLLRLRYEDERVELMILDNGDSTASHNTLQQSSGGFGLIGLRERMELLGGHITYGPVEPTGYRVTARVTMPMTNLSGASTDKEPQKGVVLATTIGSKSVE